MIIKNILKRIKLPSLALIKNIFLLSFPFSFPVVKYLSVLANGNTQQLSEWSPLKCPLYFFTEILCPTCGMTRSTLAALQFNFKESFEYHPLGVPFVFMLIFIWLILFLDKDQIVLQKIKITYSKLSTLLALNIKVISLVLFCIWGFSRNFY